MARASSKDPLDRFRWSVSIDGFERLGFTSCEVPSFSIQTKPYAEGGQHLAPKQIVEAISFKPVSFERGVTSDRSFENWTKQVLEMAIGTKDNKPPVEYRRDVKIYHLNRKGQIVKVYTLINAFPIEYTPASTFASDGDDVLSMEKLVLTYESFTIESDNKDSNPNNISDIVKRVINRL